MDDIEDIVIPDAPVVVVSFREQPKNILDQWKHQHNQKEKKGYVFLLADNLGQEY